jgi:hypothetical protein
MLSGISDMAKLLHEEWLAKANGRKPYCNTATTDNAAPKGLLGFWVWDRITPHYHDAH